MPAETLSELARRFFAAFVARDRRVYEQGLADSFAFSSPLDDRIDKAAWFARCWPNGEAMAAIEVEETFERGNAVCVRYCATLKSGKVIRNVEIFRFESGKLAEVDVYFGRTVKEAP